jgi:hypothetical protein
MKTETLNAGIFENQTDSQLIRKYGLVNNSTDQVNSILKDLEIVRIKSKSDIPTEHDGMCEWGKMFENAWLTTQRFNTFKVSPLGYLINYAIQTNTSGIELMSNVAFMPKEFQIVFAKYFVKRK